MTRCDDVWEWSRLQWSVGDGDDPGTLANAFLHSYGLALPASTSWNAPITQRVHREGGVCGASLFLSAAGAAAMIGAPPGAPSPAPAVPDLAVVVYGHHRAALADQAGTSGPVPPAAGATSWSVGQWQPSWSPDDHAAAVVAVREAIARGDVYQVNLVGHASARYVGDPGPALRRLIGLPGARYGRIMSGPGWAIASASPELLIRVRGGMVETRPIKGTRPATGAGRQELLSSAKERAEHIMIVDLERNDLAQVARTGTVTVPELFAVRRWADLWQAESRVVARLADGVDLAGLLRAVCPGGSVTGAPKRAALAHIAALEPVGRGASMGALGWLDQDQLELGLTIRTVAVDAQRLHLWAGGGITWDSDPVAEVAEAAAKAAPVRAALAA
ncbi:MAG TPA: chorismate-binding protein [Micromonosporaceae bacterium]